MIVGMTWVNIDGLDGYQVNENGQVRRLERQDRLGRTWREMILAGHVDPKGYLRYFIQGKVRFAHRLVAHAFIGPCPPGQEVLHIDGTRNNHVSNLRYGTRSENTADKVRHGQHPMASKTRCKRGHLFDEANTYRRRYDGARVCRTCDRDRQRLRSA